MSKEHKLEYADGRFKIQGKIVDERPSIPMFLDNKVVIGIYYNDTNYCLFVTEEGEHIWKKDTNMVARLDPDDMTRLLLKIEMIVNSTCIGYAGNLKC